MFGKVIVGDGGVVEVIEPVDNSNDDDDEEESVPGFLAVFSTIALVGAAFVASRRNE